MAKILIVALTPVLRPIIESNCPQPSLFAIDLIPPDDHLPFFRPYRQKRNIDARRHSI